MTIVHCMTGGTHLWGQSPQLIPTGNALALSWMPGTVSRDTSFAHPHSLLCQSLLVSICGKAGKEVGLLAAEAGPSVANRIKAFPRTSVGQSLHGKLIAAYLMLGLQPLLDRLALGSDIGEVCLDACGN